MVTSVEQIERPLTLEEFIKYKNQIPELKKMRSRAKGVNFAFLFGGGAYRFAMDTVKSSWSRADAIKYLNESGVSYNTMESTDDLYLKVAQDIRNHFFNSYYKLAEWIENTHEIAKKQGYIRSVFGARRLLPKLTYEGTDVDRKEQANFMNISVNSPVQNFEAVVITRAIRGIQEYIHEHNLKSRVFGTIHDAIGIYIARDEKDDLLPVIHRIAQREYPEFQGIPFEFEMDVADPLDPDNPTYWGFGVEWES